MNKETIKKEILNIIKNGYLYRKRSSNEGQSILINYINNTSLEDISYNWLCDYVSKYSNFKVALKILLLLLKEDVYHNEYSEYLIKNIKNFEFIINSNSGLLPTVFCCNKIRDFVLVEFNNRKECNYSVFYIDARNPFYQQAIVSFMQDEKYSKHKTVNKIYKEIGKSISDDVINIKTINDFDVSLLLRIRDRVINSDLKEAEKKEVISFWLSFYRWLVLSDEYNVLDRDKRIPYSLLIKNTLNKLLYDNYYFSVFDINNIPYGHDKIVFSYYGYGNMSSRAKDIQYTTINMSSLKSKFYKKCILSYYVHELTISYAMSHTINYVIECLCIFESVKSTPNYPEADESKITDFEAFLICQEISNDRDKITSTKNNKIGSIRRFLDWAQKAGYITCETQVYNNLHQLDEPKKVHGNPIPKDDLKRIATLLRENMNNDLDSLLEYAIFTLALQTEFRISSICSLKIDSIRPSLKPGRFKIYTSAKTTHGEKDNYEITGEVYNLIQYVIDVTHEIRSQANKDIKDYIFLYEDKTKRNFIRVATSDSFHKQFSNTLKENGINHYTAKQLRDTHMSLSMSYIIDCHKSDAELALLTKHKNIDTTIDHYVGQFLEEYLETTYNVLLDDMSDLNTDGKIQLEIPKEIENDAHSVEHGCGYCNSDKCIQLEDHYTYSLPCMLCPHFLTTPDHLPYFKEMVEYTNRHIESAKTRHGIEDYTTMKKIYISFIKAIYEYLLKKGDMLNATNTKLFILSNN